MPEANTLNLVIETVANTFAADPSELSGETVADDVDGWDSVSHTMLILALEDAFRLQIPFERTVAFANLSEMANFIDELRDS